MASVLWNQAKRNPAPVLALVLGFLLALRVFRRRD
jgi:MYXO-CTERM domain-containing protein